MTLDPYMGSPRRSRPGTRRSPLTTHVLPCLDRVLRSSCRMTGEPNGCMTHGAGPKRRTERRSLCPVRIDGAALSSATTSGTHTDRVTAGWSVSDPLLKDISIIQRSLLLAFQRATDSRLTGNPANPCRQNPSTVGSLQGMP